MEENKAGQPAEIDMTSTGSSCHGIVFFKMMDIMTGNVVRFPVDVVMASILLGQLADHYEDDREKVQAMIGLVRELSGDVAVTVSSYDAEAFFRHVVLSCEDLKKKLPQLPDPPEPQGEPSGDS